MTSANKPVMDGPAREDPTNPVDSDDHPHVSVIIPMFNGSHEIERTLGSVVAQTFPNLDILAIDDASRDSTAETVERFFRDHPSRGRLLRHETNWGLSRTLNQGLRETTGDDVLILHQDITLVAEDWVARAARDLHQNPSVAVVTGNYGLPATEETDFAQRVFGVMRRQFHAAPSHGVELATFSEFKCDLVRRSSLDAVGGFPERFRIAGEDLWVSCALRAQGWQILKDYALQSVQRFTGDATTVAGNLRKEFVFGRAIAGTLIRFRGALARGLQRTPYSRSRSWNRASQPFVVVGMIALLLSAILTGYLGFWIALAVLVIARLTYYAARLYPDLRKLLSHAGRALEESLLGAPLGIAADFAYTAGLGSGIVRWAFGRQV